MGFLGPRADGVVAEAGVALTPRGAVEAEMGSYQTSVPRIFACGDMRRGQSLVVWAIREGRDCAAAVDAFLAAGARRAAWSDAPLSQIGRAPGRESVWQYV